MIRIRPCRKEDLADFRRICLHTAFAPAKSEAEKQFMLLTYCDPYVLGEETICFAAADEEDRAAGYILCAPNAAQFEAAFRKTYLPQLYPLGKRFVLIARLNLLLYRVFARRYPAHLHIDLLEQARHQGVGTKLMQALKGRLASQGVGGLMLCCASKNQNAIRFYRRNGFKIKFRLFGSCILTSKL